MAANTSAQSMPVSDAVLRRRSADVGGLYLALRDANHGLGWLDSSTPSDPDIKISTKHAVLLSTMHTETLRLLENSVVQNDPPELSQEDRVRLLKSIESWYFEPLRMPEHEVLACVIFLFQVLFRIEGMQEAVNINFNIIPRFILHIRQLYRWQNHYHNFEHAVDVLQAIHCYLRAAGVVPPVSLLLLDANAPKGSGMWSSTRRHDSEPLVTCLTPREIFALYLAAIGHDVAHPGFNNPFMENAEAPLSQVYENGSALEQMHSYMLLKTMRYHGLGVLLDDPETGQHFRRILRGSVLATDMGVHNDFMNKFAKLLENSTAGNDTIDWQAAKFERQEFVCKLLLKNADISNPSRPFLVSKQWASALQQEWACQYKFENYLELTHSVNPSNGPLAEANSQVFFTGKIAKPLVDMTAVAIPELRQYSYHCAENLREWEQILECLKETPALPTPPSSSTTSAVTSTTTTKAISTPPQPPPVSPPLAPPLSPPHLPTTPISSPRQGSTVITPNYPNYPTFTTSSLRSQSTTTSPSSFSQQAQTPPILIPASALSSPGAIATTTTPPSSSNPVSPRILNPTSDNDYSGVFRLTRPKGSSSSTTSPSATPSSGFGMGGSSGRAGQISRTPSSSAGGGAGGTGGGAGVGGGGHGASSVVGGAPEILPSLSRAVSRVIAGTPSRTTGTGVVNVGGVPSSSFATGAAAMAGAMAGGTSAEGSVVTLLPSAVEPPKQFLPRSLMYPYPIKYARQPFQPQQSQATQDAEQEERSESRTPPPTVVPLSTTPSYSSSSISPPTFQQQPDEPEIIASLGGFGTPNSDTEGAAGGGGGGLFGGGSAGGGRNGTEDGVDEDTVYEREVEMRHQGFRRAVERGIGVGSLKKRKSGNILSGTPTPPQPPAPALATTANSNTSPSVSGFGFGAGSGSGSGSGAGGGTGSVPPTPTPTPFSPPPPPPPSSTTSVFSVDFGNGSSSPSATAGYHHQSRASWCSGESVEGWRGRLGGTRLVGGESEKGEKNGRGVGGKARVVASSEEESEDGEGEGGGEGRRKGGLVEDGRVGEGESFGSSGSEDSVEEESDEGKREGEEEETKTSSIMPAGLVFAAPIPQSSDPADLNINPQTPPRRTRTDNDSHSSLLSTATTTTTTTTNSSSNTTTIITEANRSGSPTPKAKAKLKMKMRESEVQKKRREEEEEERRRKLREELIREEEREKERMGSGGSDTGKTATTRSVAKSRSRSKLRRKTKGKK